MKRLMVIAVKWFMLCENQCFSLVFAFRLEMHVRYDNQYKTGTDRGNVLGQPMLFQCMGICVLSPAHESEMRGYLVYLLIVKYLLLFKRFLEGELFKTFLEGSVDHNYQL